MKILFYNHTGRVSGAEHLLLMILTRIDREAFEPTVVCPEEDSLSELVTKLGVPVETVASLNARFTWRLDQLVRYCHSFFKVMRELRQKVSTLKPDLIHANSIRAGLVATAATFGLGTPVIWHLHDLLPRHPFSSLIRLFALFSSRTRMIAVSQAAGRNFRGHFSRALKNRVKVILNAIDLDRFQPDQTARRGIRKELRIREADPVIGIVGQVTPRKGQVELVRAFSNALSEMPHTVLLVVGAPLFNQDYEYLKAVERVAVERGIRNNVRLLGARSDIGAIMQSLDLLIVNSAAEPFGLVILEAMASSTPVMAVAVDGIPEIIEHEKNGWLVPKGDEETLAAAMVHLSQRPKLRAQLAERAKRHVNARFSAIRYMAELQGFYLGCAGMSALESAPTSEPGAVRGPRAGSPRGVEVATGLTLNCEGTGRAS